MWFNDLRYIRLSFYLFFIVGLFCLVLHFFGVKLWIPSRLIRLISEMIIPHFYSFVHVFLWYKLRFEIMIINFDNKLKELFK